MTIKAQRGDLEWLPMRVAERARRHVPAGVKVTAREYFVAVVRLEVMLEESWCYRLRRWLRLEVGKGRVAARVSAALADSPPGLAVTVRWR